MTKEIGRIVFDIETVGEEFENLEGATQEYLLRYTQSPQEEEEAKDKLGFYPLTAQIVAIAMLEVEKDKGWVFFQAPGQRQEEFSQGSVLFRPSSEKEILQHFWQLIAGYRQFITFNGRSFDCPFIMVRSAILGIPASRNLMPPRYESKTHCDLLEQLTFQGAVRRRFSLDMWCRAFGIKSPKEEGITGEDVKELFRSGRHKDIASYCLRDVEATKKLYLRWESYTNL